MTNYIKIPLSKNGKHAGKFETIVDKKDSDLANTNWAVTNVKRKTQYAKRTMPDGSMQYLHRIILQRKLNRYLEDGEYPDHINGNGLDNRRENLRVATIPQNLRNRPKQKNNKSGYKGVYKVGKKWRARITVNKNLICLGRFETAEKAYNAYCEAAEKYHKNFKRLK